MSQETGFIDGASLVTTSTSATTLISIGRAYAVWIGSLSIRISGRDTMTNEGVVQVWEAGVRRFDAGSLSAVSGDPLCVFSLRDTVASSWLITVSLLSENIVVTVQTPDSSDEVTWTCVVTGIIEYYEAP